MQRALVGLLLLAPCVEAWAGEASERLARADFLVDESDELIDKKARWLAEKSRTPGAVDPPALQPEHPLSLRNMWTDEVLPLAPATPEPIAQAAFSHLVRCHFTQAETRMAPRLLSIVRDAAAAFHASFVEIVSGYRAPKYQLMLRKKGHEVARDSEHPRGEAVDFRIPDVPTLALLGFVRNQRAGGVGLYPVSRFVHADVGRVRFWRGH